MRVLELHAQLKTIQRSKGHSATAAAAYRSAECILDERTGLWKNYSSKEGVEHNALLLPDNAPDWAHDRSRLWNAAEKKENRKNSQTARELLVAFPHEMNTEQRRLAGYNIAQTLVERYGAGVDIAFHAPSEHGDERNYHAHILFTTRRFDAERPDGWAKTKDRVLDEKVKKRPGSEMSIGVEETLWLREQVAGIMNDISAANGLDVYTEHLSFETRGIDRVPQKHLGPLASDLERKGVATHRGDFNREIEAANADIHRLEAQKKINDLAIDREQRRIASQERPQEYQQEFQASSALPRREAFYQRIQGERTALLHRQQQDYGEREQQMRSELAALHQSTTQDGAFGFVRFLHTVTGRRESELQRITELQAEYDRMSAAKAAEAALFEQNRQAQLQALKASEVAEDERRTLPYQDVAANQERPPDGEHYNARERATAAIFAKSAERTAELKAAQERTREAPAVDRAPRRDRGHDDFEMGR